MSGVADADNLKNDAPQQPARNLVTRWAGVLGIAVPAVGLALYPIWSFPATGRSGAGVAQWAQAHHSRLAIMMLLYTTGVTLWLAFNAGIWAFLRERLPSRSTVPPCFAAGAIGYVLLLLAGFTAFDLLLYRSHSAESTQLLYDVTFGLLAMSGMPTAVSLAAFAVAVYAHRVLPRYTAHLAAVAAAAHLLLLAAFLVHDGPLSLEGFSITGIPALLWAWILATALALPRCSGRRRDIPR